MRKNNHVRIIISKLSDADIEVLLAGKVTLNHMVYANGVVTDKDGGVVDIPRRFDVALAPKAPVEPKAPVAPNTPTPSAPKGPKGIKGGI